MNVIDAIKTRRAYRSLETMDIPADLINDLTECAGLAASCFNNQPWRFVFVKSGIMLEKIHSALSKGNEWAQNSSLIIAAISQKDNDCIVKNKEYYLFDTGMAVAHIILRATEIGLVAHPIAGYDEAKVKEILSIPDKYTVITLVIVGKHSQAMNPIMNEKQMETEKYRPERLSLDKYMSIDSFNENLNKQS